MLFHGSIVAREYSIPDEPGLDTDAEMTKHGQEITVESDLDRDTLNDLFIYHPDWRLYVERTMNIRVPGALPNEKWRYHPLETVPAL